MIKHVHGTASDSTMLTHSELVPYMRRLKISLGVGPPQRGYILYGDPAYPISDVMLRPFRGNPAVGTPQQVFNAMSSARVSVEWGFGMIVQYFSG